MKIIANSNSKKRAGKISLDGFSYKHGLKRTDQDRTNFHENRIF